MIGLPGCETVSTREQCARITGCYTCDAGIYEPAMDANMFALAYNDTFVTYATETAAAEQPEPEDKNTNILSIIAAVVLITGFVSLAAYNVIKLSV